MLSRIRALAIRVHCRFGHRLNNKTAWICWMCGLLGMFLGAKMASIPVCVLATMLLSVSTISGILCVIHEEYNRTPNWINDGRLSESGETSPLFLGMQTAVRIELTRSQNKRRMSFFRVVVESILPDSERTEAFFSVGRVYYNQNPVDAESALEVATTIARRLQSQINQNIRLWNWFFETHRDGFLTEYDILASRDMTIELTLAREDEELTFDLTRPDFRRKLESTFAGELAAWYAAGGSGYIDDDRVARGICRADPPENDEVIQVDQLRLVGDPEDDNPEEDTLDVGRS